MRDAAEPMRSLRTTAGWAYQKGVIFLSTQGDIQPLNELRRTCQSRPIRPGQSTCDPRDVVTVGG